MIVSRVAQRGMTVIEVLVALTISLFLLVAVLLGLGIRAWRKVRSRRSTTEEVIHQREVGACADFEAAARAGDPSRVR